MPPPTTVPISPGFPLLAPLAVRAYALFWLASVLIYVSGNFRDIVFASIALELTGRPSGLATLQTLGTIPTEPTGVLLRLHDGLRAARADAAVWTLI